MLKSWKSMLLTAVLVAGSLHAASAYGTSEPDPYIYRDGTRIDKMGQKFGRGVTNVFTCWMEIPHSVAIEWNKTDAVSGVLVGASKGVTWTAARFLAGTYEVLTFPFPTPKDYRPIMHPEFLFTDLRGNEFPELMDMQANDPLYNSDIPTYPRQFRF
jgi:putative exosortase-associated protein (TIGR04073 family)